MGCELAEDLLSHQLSGWCGAGTLPPCMPERLWWFGTRFPGLGWNPDWSAIWRACCG